MHEIGYTSQRENRVPNDQKSRRSAARTASLFAKLFDREGASMLYSEGKIRITPTAEHRARLVGGPEAELRRWGSGEGGTTVDTGCTRLEYTGQRENQCISLQSSSRSISATAYPLAKPFIGEGATILNSRQKNPNTPTAKHWTR